MGSDDVLTAGYSLLDYGSFAELLEYAERETVADVRTSPHNPGRFTPWFAGEELSEWCRENGYAYRYLGDRLGGVPASRREEVGDWMNSDERKQFYRKRSGSEEVRTAARELLEMDATLVLCVCKDDRECHRRLLVSRVLLELPDGPGRVGHLRYAQTRAGGHCELEQKSLSVHWEHEPLLVEELIGGSEQRELE